MKKIILTLFSTISVCISIAQNIIINPGFETPKSGVFAPGCPTNNTINNCANWGGLRYQTPNGGYWDTPYSEIKYSHPNTISGGCANSDPAHGGSSYVEIDFYDYWGCTANDKKELLIQTIWLDVNKTYKATGFFRALLSNTTGSTIDCQNGFGGTPSNLVNRKIGFQFIPSSVGTTAQQIINASKATLFESQIIGATDANGWTQVTYYFKPTASQGYYFLVGSFNYNDDSWDVERSYCYIDDISVTEHCSITPSITTNRYFICPGLNAFFSTSSGIPNNVPKQWQKLQCGSGTWYNIPGQTGDAMTLSSSMLGTAQYKIRLKLTPCTSSPVYSNEIIISSSSGCSSMPAPCMPWATDKKETTGAESSLDGINTKNLEIYPNPSSGVLYLVNRSNESENMELELLDLTGKVVLKEILNGEANNIQVTINTLPDGAYFYMIKKSKDEMVSSGKIFLIK